MKYDYEGSFLEQWPAPRRSLIVNQFCYAVRAGAVDVKAVLEKVGADAQERFWRRGDGDDQGQAQRILLAVIDDEETHRFADFILWRESLSPEGKRKLKEESGQDFRLAWMKNKPPSEKQLKYLEALACYIIPANMLEATQLIDKFKNGHVQRSE